MQILWFLFHHIQHKIPQKTVSHFSPFQSGSWNSIWFLKKVIKHPKMHFQITFFCSGVHIFTTKVIQKKMRQGFAATYLVFNSRQQICRSQSEWKEAERRWKFPGRTTWQSMWMSHSTSWSGGTCFWRQEIFNIGWRCSKKRLYLALTAHCVCATSVIGLNSR